MIPYPTIQTVEPLQDKRLRVTFSTGVQKIYDCTGLLSDSSFSLLNEEWFFRQAHADPTGYGVVWNDEVDLSESEVWLHGTEDGKSGI